jgi:hypothetical protein
VEVVFVSPSFAACSQEKGSDASICQLVHISQKKHMFRKTTKGWEIKANQFFCAGCSPLRDVSFLHTVYTNLHLGTPLCHYFGDTNPRDGPVQSTRSTTQRVKSRPALAADDTAQGYAFENRTWRNIATQNDKVSASSIRVALTVTGAPVADADEAFSFSAAIVIPIGLY